MKKLSTLFLLIELIKKDLKVEARSKASLNQMLIFALTVAFLFSLSIDAERFFPQIILLIILFTSIAGSSTSILREFDLETIEGLKASPLSSSHIMTAKTLSNLIFVLILSFFVYSICYALFDLEGKFLLTLGILLIVATPISFAITLLAPLSANSKGREMLLLAMIFPIIFPILMPATRTISLAYSGVFDTIGLFYIISYTGIIYSLSLLLSDHLI
ncbi:MAG: heme exporter protein CcmB [Archaeoglobaceae archaeon]|nr:heme exporter protein CcmB [Archaeoglobaceae archaeon]MDW8118502.1 heme exporter protein CcmB [Archaeoglobaceae archaeon]